MKRLILLVLISVSLQACFTRTKPVDTKTPDGITTDTTSESFANLRDKITFVERYITFNRDYEKLDFKIFYEDNSRREEPSPSKWSISLVAVVPKADINNWITKAVMLEEKPDLPWLKSIPTTIDHSSINTWYSRGNSIIGVDLNNNIVAFHNKEE